MDTSVLTVVARQDPLRQRYRGAPAEALIVDRARSQSDGCDPFHGRFVAGSRDYGITWPFGIHHAVGGEHDLPNPGDILCASLAACLDSTLRMIAERLGVVLETLEVDVTGEVDVRGTLLVDPRVPVGFKAMRCAVTLRAAEGTDSRLIDKLLAAAERSCVTLQTLRHGVEVETELAVQG
jgi:uncharacterized OsmC-like protein